MGAIDEFLAAIFPGSPLTQLIASIFVGSVFVALICAAIAAAAFVVWMGFNSAFRATTGRAFVFTRRMASILSILLAAVIFGAVAFHVYCALQRGDIETMRHRGGPAAEPIYWNLDRSGFLWAIFDIAATMFGLWAMIASLLFMAASMSKKSDPIAPPTPPTRTSPQ